MIRVSPDGQSCDYLTRIVQDPDSTFEDVGDGFSDIQFYFSSTYTNSDAFHHGSNSKSIVVVFAFGFDDYLAIGLAGVLVTGEHDDA